MRLTRFDRLFLRAVGVSSAGLAVDKVSKDDPTLNFLLANGLALTRANYLAVEYFGNPPELDAEQESALPDFEEDREC
jgi:hypothetical protein